MANCGDLQYVSGDVCIGGNLVVAGTVTSNGGGGNGITAVTATPPISANTNAGVVELTYQSLIVTAVNGSENISAVTSNGVVELAYTGGASLISSVTATPPISANTNAGVVELTYQSLIVTAVNGSENISAVTSNGVVELAYTGASLISAVTATPPISANTNAGVVTLSVKNIQSQAAFAGLSPYPTDVGYGLQMQTGTSGIVNPEVATYDGTQYVATCLNVNGWIYIPYSTTTASQLLVIPPSFGVGVMGRPRAQLIITPVSNYATLFKGFVAPGSSGNWGYYPMTTGTPPLGTGNSLFYYEWRNLYKAQG